MRDHMWPNMSTSCQRFGLHVGISTLETSVRLLLWLPYGDDQDGLVVITPDVLQDILLSLDDVNIREFCPQLLFKAPRVVGVLTASGLGPFHPLVWDTLIQARLPVAVSKPLPVSVPVSLSPLDVPRLLVAVPMALVVSFPVAVPVVLSGGPVPWCCTGYPGHWHVGPGRMLPFGSSSLEHLPLRLVWP